MPSVFADRRKLLIVAAAAVLAAAPAAAHLHKKSRGASGSAAPEPREAASPEAPRGPIDDAERAALGGALSFVFEQGERKQAFVITLDGADERALEGDSRDSYPAAVTRDGRALAILRVDEEGESIVVRGLGEDAAAEGAASGPRAAMVRNPTFSPDGRSLVYESDAESFRDLFLVRVGEKGVTRLTNNPEGNYEPSFFPDGSLAFTSSRDGEAEIYRMKGDGTEPRRLTRSLGDDLSPRVSPDGARIAFLSGRSGADRIWLMAPDGSDQRSVRPLPGKSAASEQEREHAWSPDGKRLAFVARSDSAKSRIFVWDAERDVAVALTAGEAVDDMPAFSPDGRYLAFVSDRSGQPDLWLMRADGSGAVRVARDPGQRWLPRWVALGR
jgi:TolB protein